MIHSYLGVNLNNSPRALRRINVGIFVEELRWVPAILPTENSCSSHIPMYMFLAMLSVGLTQVQGPNKGNRLCVRTKAYGFKSSFVTLRVSHYSRKTQHKHLRSPALRIPHRS